MSSLSSPNSNGAAAAAAAGTTTVNNPYTPKGLTPKDFNTILFRECQSELSHLPSASTANQKWFDSTNRIWEEDETKTTSFLIWDSTPNLSGNRRKKQIKAYFASAARGEEENVIGKYVEHSKTIYNGDGQTCILLTSPISLARSVIIDSSPPSTTLKIQPLLPMSKITLGTMKTIHQRVSSSSHYDTIRIRATLDGNIFHPNLGTAIWEDIKMESLETKKEHVLETFPSSGTILTSQQEEKGEAGTDLEDTNRNLLGSEKFNIYNQVIVTVSPNQNEDYDDYDVEDPYMIIDIYQHANSDKGIDHTMDVKVWDVVSIVSALACRLEVTLVELEEEMVLHG